VIVWVGHVLQHSQQHCDKTLLPYATVIADVDEGHVTGWSWGSTIQAPTYRGLCQRCTKMSFDTVLTGCPLLLQLWSYEWFVNARLRMDLSAYEDDLYHDTEEDRPIMGSLWTSRWISTIVVAY
jgi:hypothetical protein